MADTIVSARREPPQASNQEVGLNCCRSHQSKDPKTESHIPCYERERERERQRKEKTSPEGNEDNTERNGIVTCHTVKKSKGST